MFPIWYVLRCEKGNERRAAKLLKQCYHFPEQADIFLITFEKMKRYEGSWHYKEELLFQGIVFAEVSCHERLEAAAHNAVVFCPFRDGGYSLCLEEEEKDFLKEIGGEEHHIAMSRGYIQNGVTFVTEGPLCGKECKIHKIDRHRRMARIDSPLDYFRKKEFWMGLEITEKN